MSAAPSKRLGKIPSIRRLPRYLKCLEEYDKQGRKMISSTEFSKDLKWLPIVVKKDLQIVSPPTKKRTGYDVKGTIAAIERFLAWEKPMPTVLIGVGHFGMALLRYGKFKGLNFLASFDTDANKQGLCVGGVKVLPMSDIQDFIRTHTVEIAVLTTPGECAQEITNDLVRFGIKAIWNFTSKRLSVPDGVFVQREDLSAGLAELTAKIKHIQGVEETSL
jgi:redox-sensing transcriptional repressor